MAVSNESVLIRCILTVVFNCLLSTVCICMQDLFLWAPLFLTFYNLQLKQRRIVQSGATYYCSFFSTFLTCLTRICAFALLWSVNLFPTSFLIENFVFTVHRGTVLHCIFVLSLHFLCTRVMWWWSLYNVMFACQGHDLSHVAMVFAVNFSCAYFLRLCKQYAQSSVSYAYGK